MARNPDHAMLAHANHDERARQDFIAALKRRISGQLRPANRLFFRQGGCTPTYSTESWTLDFGTGLWIKRRPR